MGYIIVLLLGPLLFRPLAKIIFWAVVLLLPGLILQLLGVPPAITGWVTLFWCLYLIYGFVYVAIVKVRKAFAPMRRSKAKRNPLAEYESYGYGRGDLDAPTGAPQLYSYTYRDDDS